MALFEGTWLQVHQLDSLPGDRDSLSEIITLAKKYRAGGIMLKAFDGDAWMGSDIRFPDTAPDALRSIAQIAAQKAACDLAGIGYAVWVNPLHPFDFGRGLDFLDREAGLYPGAGQTGGPGCFRPKGGA